MNECQLKCKEYESYQFKKSRVAYVSQCTFDYLISLLITDAFLAKVLAYIGLSDAQIGIISSFIYFSFLLTMINIANCITVSFMGTFKTKDLLMPVGLVQGINTLACGMRMIFSISFGKYSDKKSYAKGIELALVISAIGFMFNIFTTNTTWWCIIIYTVLYNISVAGTSANKFNTTYSYIKREYIMHAITIQNCISGIVGFFATLIGSCILTFIQNNENRFLGINVYGQQVLSVISLLIVLIAIVYDRYVVEKQEMI